MKITFLLNSQILSRLFGEGEIKIETNSENFTLRDALNELVALRPEAKERFFKGDGSINKFINFFINENDYRFLGGDKTQLNNGDEISVIPAISGG